MDSIQRIKQINSQRSADLQTDSKHKELLLSSIQTQETIVKTTQALVNYLSRSVTKTEVVNQLKEIGTPDALKVVSAVNSLHDTLKSHKDVDLTEVTTLMKSLLEETKKIPKSTPEQPDSFEVKNLGDLNSNFASLEKAVKGLKLSVEAPVVNVDKPDLSPIKTSLLDVISAVRALKFPTPELPFEDKGKATKLKLENGSVPTTQTNILVHEKFDEYRLVYDDFADEPNIEAIVYYLKGKKVARIKYSYKDGRLTGAKKVGVK